MYFLLKLSSAIFIVSRGDQSLLFHEVAVCLLMWFFLCQNRLSRPVCPSEFEEGLDDLLRY